MIVTCHCFFHPAKKLRSGAIVRFSDNSSFFVFFLYRYHEGTLYVIDVSQSVEHDHPHALEFLRKDCTNVNGGHIFILDDYIIK